MVATARGLADAGTPAEDRAAAPRRPFGGVGPLLVATAGRPRSVVSRYGELWAREVRAAVLQAGEWGRAQWWLNQVGHGGLRMPTVPAVAYWASGNAGQQLVVIPSEDLVVVRLGLSSDFEGIDWGLERRLVDVIAATS